MTARSFLTCSIVLFLLVGCTGGDGSSDHTAVELEVDVQEVLAFGSGESEPPEALLGAPRYVRTDDEGNIYVSDFKPLGIKVFDPSGNYRRTIGGQGEGPGEFQSITSMTINNAGELVVADWHSQRLLRFSPEGETLETRTMEDTDVSWPRYIEQLPNGNYVMLFRRTESDREESGQAGPAQLVHIIDEQFEETASFGTVPEHWEDERPYAVKTSGFEPGRVTVVGTDELIYVPTLYRGKLYRFRKEEGEWSLVQTLDGRVVREEAYTPLDEAPDRENRPPNVNVIHSRGDVFPAAIHNKSEAVFTLTDGRIVHFSVIQEGEERYLQAELFTQDGRLTGWGRIDNFDRVNEEDPRSRPWVRISWKDDDDRFYIVDYRGEPTVRVVNITFAPAAAEGN